MRLDQPVEARARRVRFLEDDLVQRRLVVRVTDVSANEFLCTGFGIQFWHIGQCFNERNFEFPEDFIGCGTPQSVFVLEMVADKRVMHASTVGDITRRRAFKAVLREGINGRIEQLLLCDDAAFLLLAYECRYTRAFLFGQASGPWFRVCRSETSPNLLTSPHGTVSWGVPPERLFDGKHQANSGQLFRRNAVLDHWLEFPVFDGTDRGVHERVARI